MKKIEKIIDNCIDCTFSDRYTHKDPNRKAAYICMREKPYRLAGFEGPKHEFKIPDWCPLETFNECEYHPHDRELSPCCITRNTCCDQPDYGIIIPTLPNLEWMTENLTGHGGTEIGGRWYYTYDQAVAAAAELGDGWRLPTQEEFEKLADAGSTWVDEGPDGEAGRWFGGNHDTDHDDSVFLPATGYVGAYSGALTNVGSYGNYWSSSPCSEASNLAGYLYFYSGRVIPVSGSYRAYGFSVRCAKDL